MKKLFHSARFLLLGLALSLTVGAALVPATASAQSAKQSVCEGANLTGKDCTPASGSSSPDVNHILSVVVNVFSFIVGVVAVIMIIVGGFKYVSSQGEASNIASARSTILYAIVGLIVVLLSQVIVRFVLNKTLPPCAPGRTTTASGGVCQH